MDVPSSCEVIPAISSASSGWGRRNLVLNYEANYIYTECYLVLIRTSGSGPWVPEALLRVCGFFCPNLIDT